MDPTTIVAGVGVVQSVLEKMKEVGSALGIKGKTAHLSWEDADKIAARYNAEMDSLMLQLGVVTDSQYSSVAREYRSRAISYLQSSTLWDANTRNKYAQAFDQEAGSRPTPQLQLSYCFWLVAHWIYENVPSQNLAEGAMHLKTWDANVLYPALEKGGVKISDQTGQPEGKSTSTDNTAMYIIVGVALLAGAYLLTRRG